MSVCVCVFYVYVCVNVCACLHGTWKNMIKKRSIVDPYLLLGFFCVHLANGYCTIIVDIKFLRMVSFRK